MSRAMGRFFAGREVIAMPYPRRASGAGEPIEADRRRRQGTRRGAAARRHVAVMAIALILPFLAQAADAPGCTRWPADEGELETAWQTLRVVDCARCHGKDYDGLAAPSVVEYVRATRSRERFERIVLDGDPPRGMPGYRGNPLVAQTIDELYRYFSGRAAGDIGRGKPCAERRPPATPASGTIFPASGDAGEGGDRRAQESFPVRQPERN
jgi:hypothetical protein